METIRRLLVQISAQLKLLSLSQRVAIGLCAVIVAGSLAWLVTWSSAPDRVQVLSQDMTYDELDKAEDALAGARIDYEVRGARVYVPAADRANALRLLNKAEALPQDTHIGFRELIADESPFRPSEENERRFQIALGNELAKVITSGSDVASARVFIQSETKRHLTGPATVPTASVYVTMARGKQVTQADADGFARLISGAVPGLDAHRVEVIDGVTRRRYTPPDPENAWATDMLERVVKTEQHLLKKIHEHFAYIPGILAAVTVDLDHSKKHQQSYKYDDPRPETEESRKSSSRTNQAPAETGTNPNVGIGLGGAASAEGNEESEDKTKFYPGAPTEIVDSDVIPGTIVRATASINVPRSFFVSIFRNQPGNADKDPADGDPVFETLKKKELDLIRDAVMNIVQAESDEDVRVASYYDFDPATGELARMGGGLAGLAGAADEGDYVQLARNYGPEVGLAALAVFALLGLILMVRKSTRMAAAIPSPTYVPMEDEDLMTGPDGMLRVGGSVVGDADMPEGMLLGHEVDDDTLRFKQLGEQVSRMVDDSPQVAADLLKRWVEQE